MPPEHPEEGEPAPVVTVSLALGRHYTPAAIERFRVAAATLLEFLRDETQRVQDRAADTDVTGGMVNQALAYVVGRLHSRTARRRWWRVAARLALFFGGIVAGIAFTHVTWWASLVAFAVAVVATAAIIYEVLVSE